MVLMELGVFSIRNLAVTTATLIGTREKKPM